jgi:uncharacterized protein YndB with AHSA1/START domain
MKEDRTRSITKEIELDAPVEAVWKALTDPEELTNWFPLQAGVKPDGTMWMSWDDLFYFESRADIEEPYTRIRALALPPEGAEVPPVEVVTDTFLETRGGKTVLRLVHSGFSTDTEWDDLYDATSRGWDFELRGLRHYLHHHRGTKRRSIWIRHLSSLSIEEAWRRLAGEQGLHAKELAGFGEGDRYRVETGFGDTISGVVHVNAPPRDLSVTIDELNNAMLRLRLDTCTHSVNLDDHGKTETNVFISTYGLHEGEVEATKKRWEEGLLPLLEE